MKVFLYFSSLIIKYSKRYYIIYIILSPFSAIVQAGGIVSIFPLITVATNPDKIINNEYFQKFYFLNFNNSYDLIVQLSMLFLIFNSVGILLFFLNTVLGDYLASVTSVELKNEISSKILNSHITISSERSDLLNYIFYEIGKFQSSLNSILSFYANTVSLAVFCVSVIIIEPRLFYLLSLVIFFYLSLYFFNKKPLQKLSLAESENSVKITQIILQINLGLKDLLVLKVGKKLFYLLKKLQFINIIIEIRKKIMILYPRYAFEIILYTIAVLVIINFYENNFIQNNLGLLAVVAVFIWKSIPLFFNLFRSFSIINSNISSYKKLISFSIFKSKKKRNSVILKKFNKNIHLNNVEFSYDKNKIFKFNFKIKKGEKVFLHGKSGSGKTTLLNLITGLLEPNNGKIKIDNVSVSNKNLKTNIFGYVTQEVVLFPGTIFNNLKFGKKFNKKDLNQIRQISDICGFEKIVDKFSEIFSKEIEFNSPELSGGQRQRIAIARVLMLKPEILILDEATNALDKKSETEILNNIIKYNPKMTVIIVTHRSVNFKFDKKIMIK